MCILIPIIFQSLFLLPLFSLFFLSTFSIIFQLFFLIFSPDYTKAILLLDDQQHNSEFKMRCLYRRANVFYDLKKYNAAIKDLMAILVQDPQIVYSRILLGKTLKMAGDLVRAEEQILIAIIIECDQYSHYAELGDIRFQMNRKNKIKKAIEGEIFLSIVIYIIDCFLFLSILILSK